MSVSEWYKNSGVYAQYGFEFQKIAFIYHIIKNSDYMSGIIYIYESDDDFKIINNDNTLLVQCKTSINDISIDVIDKILKNWSDYYDKHQNENITFIIHTDNFFDINKAKERIRNCKLYNEKTIKYILDNLKNEQTTEEDLFNNIKFLLCNKFFKSVINDNIKNDITNDFIDYLLSLINNKILNSKKIKNECGELDINDVLDIILLLKDYKNNFNTNIDRKIKEFDSDIVKLLSSNIKREVIQLQKINISDSIIKKYLAYMMIYEYVKSNYDSIEQNTFNNNERQAFDNYEKILYFSKPISSQELFLETIKQIINITKVASNINQFVSDGCYIYLTKEETPNDRKITWDV